MTGEEADVETRIWCLRHGEAENDLGGRVGAAPEAAVTERGRRQSVAAAQALADEPIVRVYSSTARRAIETAALVAAPLGALVTRDPRLDEIGVGVYDGVAGRSARDAVLGVLAAWIHDGRSSTRILGGESGTEVIARMSAVLTTIARDHQGGTVAVVGHTGSLTVTIQRLCGLGPELWGRPLPFATPFVVTSAGGAWRCPAWPG